MSRLIDADELEPDAEYDDGEYWAYSRTQIENALTIEPKKGRWIPFDIPWYECSECGAVRENKAFMEHYCPNCGADMREGESDG